MKCATVLCTETQGTDDRDSHRKDWGGNTETWLLRESLRGDCHHHRLHHRHRLHHHHCHHYCHTITAQVVWARPSAKGFTCI